MGSDEVKARCTCSSRVVVVALVVALAPPVHVVVLWRQVQRAFTSSLPILAFDARSAVLSSGAEFHEAVLRLVRAHLAASKQAGPRSPVAHAAFSPTEEAALLEGLPAVCCRMSALSC